MDYENLEVGNRLVLGGVEWEAILKESGRFLLFATDVIHDESGICRNRFHARIGDATWESCTLREWLNKDFLERFTTDELAHICITHVVNYDSSRYGTPGGNDTIDRVFCLSTETVRALLTEEQMAASSCWYLRSPGFEASHAANVRDNGNLFEFGRHVFLEFYGIRPAMWFSPQPYCGSADDVPFVSLFGFDGMRFVSQVRLALAFLASCANGMPTEEEEAFGQIPSNVPDRYEDVLEFARIYDREVLEAAFLRSNVEEIIRGAVNAGLVTGDNIDDILDRAREVEDWSLVATLLEYRAHGLASGCRMTEEERMEREIFGDLL